MKRLLQIGSWAWKLIAAFAVIFGLWVGYVTLFSITNISAQLISETNVLDVHEPLANLQVLFQGEDIQQKNLNLKIYHVQFQNTGSSNITQNDFDENTNWGIEVDNGSVIEARLVESNSQYIQENLSPRVGSSTPEVVFNKIIFDKGDSFTVEILVLHQKDTLPALYRFGKIAGIESVKSPISEIQKQSFWPDVTYGIFYGDLYTILARFIIYAFVSIVIFMAVIVAIVKYQEKRTKAQQRPQLPQQPN